LASVNNHWGAGIFGDIVSIGAFPKSMFSIPITSCPSLIQLNPVAIGKGRTMFEGLKNRLALKLFEMRTFGNGNMLLKYEPVR
jgi:hypothetical protein